MGPDDEPGVVKDGESVDNVGAQARVDVVRQVLALAGSVPRPVGKVTHNLR